MRGGAYRRVECVALDLNGRLAWYYNAPRRGDVQNSDFRDYAGVAPDSVKAYGREAL